MPRRSIRERLADWLAPEYRALYGGPQTVSPGGTGIITLAGAGINPRTALSVAAVWSAVNCYANTIGAMSFYVAESGPDGSRRPAPEHPAYELLRLRPNARSTSIRFRQALIGHACTFGNGYAEIQWDGRGSRPVALHLLDPRSIRPHEVDGRVVYKQDHGGPDLASEDVLHLAMFGWDGVQGYSPVEVGRETLGIASAQRDYQAGLFNNSAAAQGHLEVAGNLTSIQANQLRTFWNKMHQGPQNSGNIGILEGGMRWVQSNFSPQDAELILGCKLSVEDVARLWNLPQHKLNLLDHSPGADVEQQNIDFYQSSILPWLVAIEQEWDLKLLGRSERKIYGCYHDIGGLLRANLAAQTARDSADLSTGVRSLNEVRVARGLNPIPDKQADYHWIPVNNLSALELMAGSPEIAGGGPEPGGPAQVASLLDVAARVAAGTLPIGAATSILSAGFPDLTPGAIAAILAPNPGPAAPAPAPAVPADAGPDPDTDTAPDPDPEPRGLEFRTIEASR